METFILVLKIIGGILLGIFVCVLYARWSIKKNDNNTKRIVTDEDTSIGLKTCPDGHLYKHRKQCPYCSLLKDFNPPKRELNLEDIRTHFQSNINFKEFITDILKKDAESRGIKSRYIPNLSFEGGWGYSMEDAIIIDLEDSLSCIQLEREIVELRLNLELFLGRQRGDRFYVIKKKSFYQGLLNDGKKKYDKLEYEHICLSETDNDELVKEYEEYEKNPTAYSSDFLLEHNKKRVSLMYHVKSEFFFDITKIRDSFYEK